VRATGGEATLGPRPHRWGLVARSRFAAFVCAIFLALVLAAVVDTARAEALALLPAVDCPTCHFRSVAAPAAPATRFAGLGSPLGDAAPVRTSFTAVDQFQSLAATDDQTAWAAGNLGSLPGRGVGSSILLTVNGGTSWSRWHPTSVSLFGVAAASAGTAYAVGEGGTIVHTTDGGATWDTRRMDTTADLRAVSSPSNDVAWVGGARGLVALTVNGGVRWRVLHTGVHAYLDSISSPSSRVAWIAYLDGQVARTVDGGAHWKVSDVDFPQGLLSVAAVNGRVAWAVGEKQAIAKTEDGGATWVRQRPKVGYLMILSVSAVSERVAWATGIGYGTTVLRTVDGGKSWEKQRPAKNNLRAICGVSAEVAWGAGDFGLVRRTTDSGATWAPVGPSPEPSAVAVPSSGSD
jgi:photosystem II stability/assembly factor-like uncharacterized protein